MPIEKSALGNAIRQVRLARGLTQVQLAQAAGFSKGGNSIALVEQGKRFVSLDALNSLAKALDVPPACLAILGSSNRGPNKAAVEFIQSLQDVVRAVIHVQAGGTRGGEKPRRTSRQKDKMHETATKRADDRRSAAAKIVKTKSA